MSDKATVELIKRSLIYTAEEMGVALRRSAYSPNIRERVDHSCAVLDSYGRTIGQAEHIPVHLGSLPVGLRNTLQYLEREGVELEEGDVVVVNDPYISGTHLNDITLIQPVFHRGELVAYAANKAHHSDVGGASPASISADADEIHQEGIVIPPTKLVKRGRTSREVLEMITRNVRMPGITLGDLHAQLAANTLGARNIAEIINRYGAETFLEACSEILDQTERMVRLEYENMPEGEYAGEDYLETISAREERPARIAVKVRISPKGIEMDFSGTEKQVKGPVNTVYGVTVAASMFAVRSMLSQPVEVNDGFYRTVRVYAPEGCMLNARWPAAVSAGNVETSQRVVDAIYRALSQAVPDRIPAAAHGSMTNLMMGGVHPRTGERWAFYETIGGGYGGRRGKDGVDGIHVNMTNTLNTPIEVIELYYPVIFDTYSLRPDSMGHGEFRGGCGIERSFTALAEIDVTIVGERGRIAPWGLWGGTEASPSEYLVQRRSGEVIRLSSKARARLSPGDRLIIRTAGGGGYGEPRRRSRERVLRDLQYGLISRETAERVYGVKSYSVSTSSTTRAALST